MLCGSLILGGFWYLLPPIVGSARPIVVIGASAAGVAAIKEFVKEGHPGPLVWIAQQKELPYNRVKIGGIIAGSKTKEQIQICQLEHLPSSIQVMFGTKVESVDPIKKHIRLADGKTIAYEKALIATGTREQTPPYGPGQFRLSRVEDSERIKEYLNTHTVRKAVVVGLGLNGLELIDILIKQGIAVQGIDIHDRVLHRILPHDAAKVIQDRMKQLHIGLHLNCSVNEVKEYGELEVILSTGEKLLSDIVVFAVGGSPETSFLTGTDVRILEDGALWTDEQMRTSHVSLYAAGDVAAIRDRVTGVQRRSLKWGDAQKQGIIAARSMMGKDAHYDGSLFLQSSHFFGLSLVVCGAFVQLPEQYRRIVITRDSLYASFLLEEDHLKGFLLISKGKLSCRSHLKEYLLTESPVTEEILKDCVTSKL